MNSVECEEGAGMNLIRVLERFSLKYLDFKYDYITKYVICQQRVNEKDSERKGLVGNYH